MAEAMFRCRRILESLLLFFKREREKERAFQGWTWFQDAHHMGASRYKRISRIGVGFPVGFRLNQPEKGILSWCFSFFSYWPRVQLLAGEPAGFGHAARLRFWGPVSTCNGGCAKRGVRVFVWNFFVMPDKDMHRGCSFLQIGSTIGTLPFPRQLRNRYRRLGCTYWTYAGSWSDLRHGQYLLRPEATWVLASRRHF